MECEICYAPTDGLYCYGYTSLKQVDSGWFGSSACIHCQSAWMERHTVICVDCGNSFVVVNAGRASHCEDCSQAYRKKTQNVSSENWRTRTKGLTSDLQQAQWIETLTHFNNSCAYCDGPYKVIEHFTPVRSGGGTGADNCVPACVPCNRKKNILDGRRDKKEISNLLNIPAARLEQIQEYLDKIFNRTAVR